MSFIPRPLVCATTVLSTLAALLTLCGPPILRGRLDLVAARFLVCPASACAHCLLLGRDIASSVTCVR